MYHKDNVIAKAAFQFLNKETITVIYNIWYSYSKTP